MSTILGTLPISIPQSLVGYYSWNPTQLSDPMLMKVMTIILTLIQFFMSHFMRGNLGKCFCGLEVKRIDGMHLSLWQSVLRSAHYLLFIVVFIVSSLFPAEAFPRLGLSFIGVMIIMFIAFNGVFVIFEERNRSIMDMLVKSEVVMIKVAGNRS